jgi:MscS family membrane protein
MKTGLTAALALMWGLPAMFAQAVGEEPVIAANPPPAPPSLATPQDILNALQHWPEKYLDLSVIGWWEIGYFVGVLLVAMIAGQALRWLIGRHFARLAARTETQADDLFFEAIGKPISLLAMAIGLFVGAMPMLSAATESLRMAYNRFCLALTAVAVAWAIYRMVSIVDYLLGNLAKKTETQLDDMLVAIIRKALRIAVAVIAVLFIGQNILGLNITTLLGAAGVAGLAVAFAAQDTISNFFGSVMIIIDQPFIVGDRVTINGTEGIVESLGFRSTRLKNLDGHLITIPNKQVADAVIINISRRPHIKLATNLTLVYDTPPEKMEEALAILHEIYDQHEGMDPAFPARIHFNAFNDWSLNIQVVVWYHPPEYWDFMAWSQRCNLEILRRFNAAGIEFAFPTSTTYLAQDGKRRLDLRIENREAAPDTPS